MHLPKLNIFAVAQPSIIKLILLFDPKLSFWNVAKIGEPPDFQMHYFVRSLQSRVGFYFLHGANTTTLSPHTSAASHTGEDPSCLFCFNFYTVYSRKHIK